MIAPLSEMEEDFDGVVSNHRNTSFNDTGFLQYQTFDKSLDSNWVNMLAHQVISADDNGSHTMSHINHELSGISELTSLEYGQSLPSLESVPVGSKNNFTPSSHGSLFAWHPFGSSQLHNPPQPPNNNQSFAVNTPSSSFHHCPSSPTNNGHHLISVLPQAGNYNNSVLASSSVPTPNTDPTERHASVSSSSVNSANNESPYASYSAEVINYPTNNNSTGTYMTKSRASSDLRNMRLRGMLLPPNSPNGAAAVYGSTAMAGHNGTNTNGNGGLANFCPTSTATSTNSGAKSINHNNSSSNFFNTTTPAAVDSVKMVNQKQRSKKESHNRIERKRRDYINSQIVYLSSLLPPELYRDVDGRRNKGSVLRLSVNYIIELRNAVSRIESLKQENAIARQLIPLLLQRIENLEKIISDENVDIKPSARLSASGRHSPIRNLQAIDSVYQSWLLLNEANQRAHVNGLSSANNNSNSSNNIVHSTSTMLCVAPNGNNMTSSNAGPSPNRMMNTPHMVLPTQQQQQQQPIAGSMTTDHHYLHELIHTDQRQGQDLDGKMNNSNQSKLGSLKREHFIDEEHGDEEDDIENCGGAGSDDDDALTHQLHQNASGNCLSMNCSGTNMSGPCSNYTASDRIEEEVVSQDDSFESRPNSTYNCYQHQLS